MKLTALKKILATSFIASAFLVLIGWPVSEVLADTGLSISGQISGQGELSTDLVTIIGGAIGIVLSLVGVIFLVLMIYAGILWMTASGNDEQVGKAKKIIFQTTIGLVVVFTAYAITSFVVTTIGWEDDGSWTIDNGIGEDGEVINEGDSLEEMLGSESEEEFDSLIDELVGDAE